MELQGTPHLVGRLWARMRKDRETATFEYDKSWLAQSTRRMAYSKKTKNPHNGMNSKRRSGS